MTKRDPVQGLWIGERLSKIEQLCVKSFLARGHPFHLYSYNALEDVPSGASLKDANAIIPQEKMDAYPSSDPAFLSDWFRFVLLAEKGGWWVDMDTICLRPLDIRQEIVLSRGYASHLMKFPPKHPMPVALAFYTENHDAPAPWNTWKHRARKFWRRNIGVPRLPVMPRECSGLKSFDRALFYFHLERFCLPSEMTMGFKERESDDAAFQPDPDDLVICEGAYCLHLGNSGVVSRGMDKNADYHETSPIERLKRRYGV